METCVNGLVVGEWVGFPGWVSRVFSVTLEVSIILGACRCALCPAPSAPPTHIKEHQA